MQSSQFRDTQGGDSSSNNNHVEQPTTAAPPSVHELCSYRVSGDLAKQFALFLEQAFTGRRKCVFSVEYTLPPPLAFRRHVSPLLDPVRCSDKELAVEKGRVMDSQALHEQPDPSQVKRRGKMKGREDPKNGNSCRSNVWPSVRQTPCAQGQPQEKSATCPTVTSKSKSATSSARTGESTCETARPTAPSHTTADPSIVLLPYEQEEQQQTVTKAVTVESFADVYRSVTRALPAAARIDSCVVSVQVDWSRESFLNLLPLVDFHVWDQSLYKDVEDTGDVNERAAREYSNWETALELTKFVMSLDKLYVPSLSDVQKHEPVGEKRTLLESWVSDLARQRFTSRHVVRHLDIDFRHLAYVMILISEMILVESFYYSPLMQRALAVFYTSSKRRIALELSPRGATTDAGFALDFVKGIRHPAAVIAPTAKQQHEVYPELLEDFAAWQAQHHFNKHHIFRLRPPFDLFQHPSATRRADL